MTTRRPWLVLLLVALATAALVVQRVAAPTRRPPPAAATTAPIERVVVADDRQRVQALRPDGSTAVEYTLDDWQAWAEVNLEERLGESVRIGEHVVPPSAFEGFGAAALAPTHDQVAITTTAYAMLTTVSVVGLLDPADRSLEIVGQVYGDVDEIVWSPGGRWLAYTLGTARAAGDELRIDDAAVAEPLLALTAVEVLEMAARQGLLVADDPQAWLPNFRDLAWSGDDRLLFTTSDPTVAAEEGAVRWSVAPEGADLRLE
jgi:hypothetical protein